MYLHVNTVKYVHCHVCTWSCLYMVKYILGLICTRSCMDIVMYLHGHVGYFHVCDTGQKRFSAVSTTSK